MHDPLVQNYLIMDLIRAVNKIDGKLPNDWTLLLIESVKHGNTEYTARFFVRHAGAGATSLLPVLAYQCREKRK